MRFVVHESTMFSYNHSCWDSMAIKDKVLTKGQSSLSLRRDTSSIVSGEKSFDEEDRVRLTSRVAKLFYFSEGQDTGVCIWNLSTSRHSIAGSSTTLDNSPPRLDINYSQSWLSESEWYSYSFLRCIWICWRSWSWAVGMKWNWRRGKTTCLPWTYIDGCEQEQAPFKG